MKGRYVGRNIRLVNDVVQQTKIQNIPRGGGESRSGTEKRCSHNLQSGRPAWWSADNYSIFPTVTF